MPLKDWEITDRFLDLVLDLDIYKFITDERKTVEFVPGLYSSEPVGTINRG